ncbi:FMN-linked oxidoreductase [Schizophyllum commune H4-8]|nr:FMN-linked oxidoreductase [Schizophyllum commune H4-8]KAI5896395.1 FMN-linked oxidoreductase [Schizophyllum commune H4-8]
MSTPKLFQPTRVGALTLQHRIVLAPMGRMRCSTDHVPFPIMKEYYAQRGSTPGTLLVSEATQIAPGAAGMPNIPGFHSEAQIAAWKEIADAVHANQSFLFIQLWATGRAGMPAVFKAEGFPYVSSSAIKLEENEETPRELTKGEIKEYIAWYAQAAKNAIAAGADGVEIHAANGYLIDQFLQDVTNVRSDEYGGSVENRARFGLEVVDAVVGAIGADRTGIRFSPWGTIAGNIARLHIDVSHAEPSAGMGMKDPKSQFGYVVEQLKAKHPNLAYVHVIESRVHGVLTVPPEEYDPTRSNDFIRAIWAPRPLISCGAYSRKLALEIAESKGDIIAVGRPFISNRWRNDWDLSPYKREFFYIPGGGVEGYLDYPFVTEAQMVKAADASAVETLDRN